MSNPSPADELRAAATKLRETAADAASERWDALFPDVRAPHIKATNAWIRLMSPAVAEPLAAWLESAGNDLSGAEASVSRLTDLGEDFDPIDLCDEPTSVRRALDLARTILGSTS
jgi:hypothetical protein